MSARAFTQFRKYW